MASLDAREFTVGAAAGFALAMCAAYAYQQRERKRDTARKPIGRRRSLTSDQSYLQGQRSDARPHHTAAVKAWQRAKDDVLSQFRAKYPAGFGSELVLLSQIKVDNVFLLPVPHLSDYHEGADLPNRMGIGCANKEELQQSYNKLMGDQDVIIHDIVRKPNADPVTTAYLRAGPRDVTHFNPCKARSAQQRAPRAAAWPARVGVRSAACTAQRSMYRAAQHVPRSAACTAQRARARAARVRPPSRPTLTRWRARRGMRALRCARRSSRAAGFALG